MPPATNPQDDPIRTVVRGGKPAGEDPSSEASKLLDRLREVLRARQYTRGTEETYYLWVKRFIDFHNARHLAEMAGPKINAFLTNLAVKDRVCTSTQNQVRSVLLFFYRHVLDREIGDLGDTVCSGRAKTSSVVPSREKV